MARPLVRWLGATLLGCAVLGTVYLPPRGIPTWARSFRPEVPADNASRIRARRLASEWREANAELQERRYRERVRAAVAGREAAGRAGPVILVEGPDSFRTRTEPLLQEGLDSVWARLGIGESKITVAVLARDPLEQSLPGRLARFSESVYGITFILPDTSDRGICLTQARHPNWLRTRNYPPRRSLLSWSASVLGPCAFYARFGMPSHRLEQWLAARRFDLALMPGWDDGRTRAAFLMDPDDAPETWRWFMQHWVYSYPRVVAACYAGRAEACRRAVATGDFAQGGPRPRVVVPRDQWDPGKQLLLGSDRFLSLVMSQAGPERFQEFWTTSLPVDSALTVALGEPVGDFTVRLQRAIGPAPHFGAAPRPLDAALGLAFAALVVGLVVVAQRRREVR